MIVLNFRKMVPIFIGYACLMIFLPDTMAQPGQRTDSIHLKGLKDYFRDYFPIGVAVSPNSFKGLEDSIIIHEFNSLTPENAMKMGPIHPRESDYNWKDADSIVSFAQHHHMKIRGHNLCWHAQTPEWLFKDKQGNQVTKEILLQRLKDHITRVVSRYKGRVYAWDVVNEAISDDSSEFLRNSQWTRICGDEFIQKAFEYAHEADPQAQLFYNDYNTEHPEKRERVYRLLKKLVDAHVPINGVGIQAHWSIYEPSVSNLEKTIEQFASLGLKIQITELDISVYPGENNPRPRKVNESDAFTSEKEQLQMDQYVNVFTVFRKYRKAITGVTFWNVSDKYSWLDFFPVPGRKNYPLLFDQQGKPKKAYYKVVEPLSKNITGPRQTFVSFHRQKDAFPVADSGTVAPLILSANEYTGVIRATRDLISDVRKVTGDTPSLYTDSLPASRHIILVGTLGKNAWIDSLVRWNRIDIRRLKDHWETYLISTIPHPFPGVDEALVIAGSDKRGTIYGLYDISSQIGVSPWYWWADVPVISHKNVYILPGEHTIGEPAVKYRGIFINDEAPSLTGWANEKFGGLNHQFYEKVFELILRLKGNFLWPAMWGNAFNDDDPLNATLADQYGVVMGTSHHEPMLRSQQEWKRYGSGPWNYDTNEDTLKKFWREGIRKMDDHESVVTVGMRGDGDKPMSEESNIALLERIVTDQRQILQEETQKKASDIPQVWALYKEVQDYYDKGMRVPDDVTLLLCDDNWGNIRKLPGPDDPFRTGGYGIYYHFDYVGDPRNYKWLNTNPISRVWEQMNLAYRYGADKLWIVNVGDIKPMEFPISFFLDFAWNPDKFDASQLEDYTRLWAEQQFGSSHAGSIAKLITAYTRFNGRRKPELLSPDTYSIFNYNEAERISGEYNELAHQADSLYSIIPDVYKDAYFQLVLYPVKACANLNEMYELAAKNRMYALQGRAAANDLAERVSLLFDEDAKLSETYNHQMAHGKWDHMMDQTHIGYTWWQQPPVNVKPEVSTILIPDKADAGFSVEGFASTWTDTGKSMQLPLFSRYRHEKHYFEIFNKGKQPFTYRIKNPVKWMHVSSDHGVVTKEQRVWVEPDWSTVPAGRQSVTFTIQAGSHTCKIKSTIINPEPVCQSRDLKITESAGYASFEAENYSKAVGSSSIRWLKIPEFGRTLSGMTPAPVTSPRQIPLKDSIRLEYDLCFTDTGSVKAQLYFSPSLNFLNKEGLSYAISVDNESPQPVVVNLTVKDSSWSKAVSDNILIIKTVHHIRTPGKHVLKFWMIDPGLVLQKVVLDMGGVKPSYLGPR